MADKQEGATEQMLSWFVILIIVLVCMYFVYRNYAFEVHSLIRWIRYLELSLITLFTPETYKIVMPNGEAINVERLREILAEIPKESLDTTRIADITSIALLPFKWFIVAIIALIGFWTYTRGPGTQYTEIFNLDRFIRFQAQNFPIISPFVKFNPSNQTPRPPGSDVPAELPAFAEALGPEEWLAYYQNPVKDNKIDKNAAFKAFARQLGPRWKGAKDLPPYKQVILAACCLKAARKRDKADIMLGRLARCWSHEKGLQLGLEKGLLREARKILSNKELATNVLKKCNQHAWQTTAMIRALATAREEGGVLAPSQFVWLRAYDRDLWYPLNNLGRQSNHIEAIGAMAHYKAEKRAQRPIPKPKVHDAVESIAEYMMSLNARPIPKLDYNQSSNKSGIRKPKQA